MEPTTPARAPLRPLSRLDRTLIWATVAVGLLLPWATGVGVKLYLQAQGKPTFPWSYFFGPVLVLELSATAVFALPFVVLALAGCAVLQGRIASLRDVDAWETRAVLLGGLLGGVVGALWTFVRVFFVFDPMVLLVSWIVATYYLPHLCAGLVAGLGVALAHVWLRRRRRLA